MVQAFKFSLPSYKCGRIGHMSNDCLVRQNRNHPISNSSIPQELKIVYAKLVQL